jgi:hypothetical protein
MSLVAGGLPAAKRVIGGREYWLSDKDLLDYWFKGLIVGADLAPGVVFNKWQSSFWLAGEGAPLFLAAVCWACFSFFRAPGLGGCPSVLKILPSSFTGFFF